MSIFVLFYNSYIFGLIFVTILLSLVYRATKQSFSNFPPGPKGWPILGYLPFLLERPDEVVVKLSRQYDHVFGFRLGTENVVILNSLESIKDAFIKQGDVFRSKPSGFKLLDYGMDFVGKRHDVFLPNTGFLSFFSEEGDSWKEQRTFAVNALKENGLGKMSLEDRILEECDGMVEQISKFEGKPFKIMPLLVNTTANIMFFLTFGERLGHDDPELKQWTELVTEIDIALNKMPAVDFFPLISKLPHWMNGLQDCDRLKKDFSRHVLEKIKQMKSTDDANTRGYVGCFLKKMHEKNAKGDKNHRFEISRLQSNLLALIVGGSVSTGITLTWTIRLLLLHPEVKNKVVHEIATVLGKDRRPSWLNRPDMPYTEATILEAQRMADVNPIGVPHSNAEAAKVMGYDIPKRSMVFANYKKLHANPELWGDPKNFRPDRFIDPDSGKCVKPEYLMAFGAGRRICPGEVIARMNLFFILVTILQKFSIESADDITSSQDAPMHASTLVRYIKPFDMYAKPI